MDKKLKIAARKAMINLDRNAPAILTGFGIAGFFGSIFLAVKATPTAMLLIDEIDTDKEPTTTEIVKATWRCYIPSGVMALASTACILGAYSMSSKRYAALSMAYNISESAFANYRQSVIKDVGEKHEKKIHDAAVKEKADNSQSKVQPVFIPCQGNTLCYDTISDRYFFSDIDDIRKAENVINRRLLEEMYVSLNDFYYEIPGLGPIGYVGDEMGWNVDDGYLEIRFSSILTKDEKPCLCIDYAIGPRYEFDKLR